MRRITATDAKRFGLSLVMMCLIAAIPAHLHASQELPASGGLKPLSGINRAWLEKNGGTSSWGRDPFYFPRAEAHTNQGGEVAEAGGMKLSAILYHEEGSVAVINHRIVRQGDLIGGRKVVSIFKDRVILQDLNGASELKLDPFGAK